MTRPGVPTLLATVMVAHISFNFWHAELDWRRCIDETA